MAFRTNGMGIYSSTKKIGGEQLKVMESCQLTALIVDDDTMIRMIHRKMLNKVGVKNEAVKNGKEAVEIHRSGQRFDLVLMDWDMPVMNGIEATKTLRSMGINSVIVGVSTHSTRAHIQEFMEAGVDDYLEKPLTSDKLTSIIHMINEQNT
ncbi:Two-component response regulator ARR22, partial [Mucuna pruriens]